MGIYLALFFICTFLTLFISKEKNSKKNVIILLIIISLLSFFGGLRDYNIGTDIEVYGKSWFEIASSYSSFKNYLEVIETTEYGYVFLNYVVSRITNDPHVFLTILQFFCNSLVIVTLYNNRKTCKLWMSLIAYLCIYYCLTFNILRQACALSILFYSIKYLKRNQNLKFVISLIIATLFHSTAMLAGIIIFCLYKVLENKKEIKQRRLLLLFSIIFFLITIYIKNVITFGYNIGIIDYRIYRYMTKFAKSNIVIPYFELSFKFGFLSIAVFNLKKIIKKNNEMPFLFLCTIIDSITFLLKIIMSYSERFSFYFGYYGILFIPEIINDISENRKKRFVTNIFYVLSMILYWYIKYVKHGACEVYPYSSQILGI